MQRGEVWWVDLDERRPVVLLSDEEASGFRAIQVVPPADIEVNGLAVEVPVGAPEGLPLDGVVRVALPRPGLIPCTWLATLTHGDLIEQAGALSSAKLSELEEALRLGGLDQTATSWSRQQPALRVTTCESAQELGAASDLFNQYRHHYGQPPDRDDLTLGWLSDMVRSKMLRVYTASVGAADSPPIGLATSHAVPASLVMGQFWQLRDLYVLPRSRRLGAAAALVNAVQDDALAAGATRLSLVTEPDNEAALGLYRSLGFRRVEGLASLCLDLGEPDTHSSRTR